MLTGKRGVEKLGYGALEPHCIGRPRSGKQRGNAIVEFGLVAPVLFTVLLAIFDGGLYVYSFVSVQSAARAAAIRNSGGVDSAVDQVGACSIAKDQLQGLPSISGLTGSCSATPLVVTSVLCSGSAACGSASSSADGTPAALVTVQYTIPMLFHMPLTGSGKIAIASQMKLRSTE